MSCGICDLKYVRNRLEIECMECKFSACSSCYKNFLYTNDVIEIRCVNCLMNFQANADNEYFFFKNMPKRFRADNERRVSNLLFNRIQATAPNLETMKNTELKCREMEQKLKADRTELANLRRLTRILKQNIYDAEVEISDNRNNSIYQVLGQKCGMINCIGYIDESGMCRVCKSKICINCNCELGENHKCNEDDIKSVEFVKQSTQMCPKCKISISKIDGCDQMWCVKCKTKFSYKSGNEIVGPIHNPHQTEYYANNPIENGANEMLNDCDPIASPHYELTRFMFNNGNPYANPLNYIRGHEIECESYIRRMEEFMSDIGTKKRQYKIIVNMMIRDKFDVASKKALLNDYLIVEKFKKVYPILKALHKGLIEILWWLVENRTEKKDRDEYKQNKFNVFSRAIHQDNQLCFNAIMDILSVDGTHLVKSALGFSNWFEFTNLTRLVEDGFYPSLHEWRYADYSVYNLTNK